MQQFYWFSSDIKHLDLEMQWRNREIRRRHSELLSVLIVYVSICVESYCSLLVDNDFTASMRDLVASTLNHPEPSSSLMRVRREGSPKNDPRTEQGKSLPAIARSNESKFTFQGLNHSNLFFHRLLPALVGGKRRIKLGQTFSKMAASVGIIQRAKRTIR